jgi:hypothetical protein
MSLSELGDLFQELLGPKRRLRFGVRVTGAAADLSVIDAEFRFLAGRSYCCTQPGCHLPWNCERLVRLAAERSIRLPDDVTVRWHCLVEEGARNLCLREFGRPIESKAHEFDFVSGGPSATIKAADRAAQKPPPDFTGLWTIERFDGGRTEIEYVDGVPNGSYRSWLENGVCLREGCKRNGKWHGTLITRKSDGTVLDVSEFEDGTGTYRIFNTKGRLTDEVPLRNGKPHGVARRWRSEKLVVTEHFVDGKRVAAECR